MYVTDNTIDALITVNSCDLCLSDFFLTFSGHIITFQDTINSRTFTKISRKTSTLYSFFGRGTNSNISVWLNEGNQFKRYVTFTVITCTFALCIYRTQIVTTHCRLAREKLRSVKSWLSYKKLKWRHQLCFHNCYKARSYVQQSPLMCARFINSMPKDVSTRFLKNPTI